MGKYAHFEKVDPRTLEEVYARHAEVAREIHEKTARDFSGDQTLKVDLIRQDILDADPKVLEEMSKYDVVSLSSVYTDHAGDVRIGVYDKQTADTVRDFFEQNEMPIYVVSAGNEGMGNIFRARMADLMGRNSLVVGEAHVTDQVAYVEKHSSEGNPTLVCDSPFNRGERYQYFDPSPSLKGHEDLVREKLYEWEIKDRADRYAKSEPPKDVEGLIKLRERAAVEVEKENLYDSSKMDERVKGVMKDPTEFHKEVMGELREKYSENGLDEKGFLTGIDGTSFSGPEQAGYVTGTDRIQDMRLEKGLPVLTEEEISSLVKMATYDTQRHEHYFPMELTRNSVGNAFTEPGGHGVFSPDMYEVLLDRAYQKLEIEPNLDRDLVQFEVKASVESKDYYDSMNIKMDIPDNEDVMIDRVYVELNCSNVSERTSAPDAIALERDGQEKVNITMQSAIDEKNNSISWARSEQQFGEILKDNEPWKMGLVNFDGFKSDDARVVVYGYKAGGFMEQMMKYSQEIAPNYEPKPQQGPIMDEAPEAEAAEPTSDSANEMKMPF